MKLALCLLPGLAFAQSNWTVPPEFAGAGYTRETEKEAIVFSGPGPSGALTETFNATPYRGQQVRLRASIRVEGGGKAQLLLRVDLPNRLGFFDDMGDRPIESTERKTYELVGDVAPDAQSIEAGVLSTGKTRVWIDSVSFEKLPPPSPEAVAARAAIQENYARVDAAYGSGDVDAIAALAAPDAQVVISGARSPLASVLVRLRDQIRTGGKIQSRSTVTSFRLGGSEATVWVNNEINAGNQAVLSCNRDTWVRTGAGWRLKESSLVGTRAMTPSDVLAEIRERSGLPSFQGVRIVIWAGRTPPAIEGFTVSAADVDWGDGKVAGIDIRNPRAAAAQALRYLKEHVPEEAGAAELTLQGDDAPRISAVVRLFDSHPAETAEWLYARQAAMVVYQSHAMLARRDEAMAGNVVWLASQAHPREKIVVRAQNAAGMATWLRSRYGKQLYIVGAVPRELLGGEQFLDIASVPAGTPLFRWLAAQRFSGVYDGLIGQ